MTIPDKIRIIGVERNKNGTFGSWTTRPFNGEVYIRRDTLLEWLEEHKRVIETNGDERDAYLRGEYSALNSLIDKINSM